MMDVRVTVERNYKMDEAKVIAAFGHYMEEHGQSLEDFLKESFFELCGFDRDEDHIDGTYVWLEEEHSESDFDFPREPAESKTT